jgi:hypothetical protein
MAQSADRERTRLQDTADKMERMLKERHESQVASEQAVSRADVHPCVSCEWWQDWGLCFSTECLCCCVCTVRVRVRFNTIVEILVSIPLFRSGLSAFLFLFCWVCACV